MNLPHGPRGLELAYCWGAPESYGEGVGHSDIDPIIQLTRYAKLTGNKISTCNKCNKPYIVDRFYVNEEQCIKCSSSKKLQNKDRVHKCPICKESFKRDKNSTRLTCYKKECRIQFAIKQRMESIEKSKIRVTTTPVARPIGSPNNMFGRAGKKDINEMSLS